LRHCGKPFVRKGLAPFVRVHTLRPGGARQGVRRLRGSCGVHTPGPDGHDSFATASPGIPTRAVRQAVLWRLSAHEAVRRPPCVTGTSVREPASCESSGGADLRRATADSRPQLGGPFRRSRPCNPSGLPASQLTPVPQLGSESSDKISSMDGAGQRLPRAAHDEGGFHVQTATTQYDRDGCPRHGGARSWAGASSAND
jgi:hypothetical protein